MYYVCDNETMLEELNKYYDELQLKYGDKNLDAIYNGGCKNNPRICFIFMNPTGKNIASNKNWRGIKSPWIGTKNIWDLFYSVNILDKKIYDKIKKYKPSDWNYEFAEEVYRCVEKHKYFITNLGKCTKEGASPIKDKVYSEYLNLLLKEIEIIDPKVIILFGSQVSKIVLNENIKMSMVRKKKFIRKINSKDYTFYSVYYPVGNGRSNISKSIEDIKYIIEKEL